MSKRSLFILVTVIGMPIGFLLLAELVLFTLGYSSTYEYEDPFLGFKDVTPLFRRVTESGSTVYRTRRSKLEWFNEQEFPVTKGANEFRIFCFGGSTTYGRPYSATTSFSNWLQVLLNSSDPGDRKYQVINVGGVSYASYRVVNLMKEIVQYEPDLFVVYTGHNEFLEDRTYSEILQEPAPVTFIREQLNHLRTYSLARDLWTHARMSGRDEAGEKFLMTGEVDAMLDQSFGLDRYHRDDEKANTIIEHFRSNLELMADIAKNEGVDLLLVVPASNEKDFSPFRSEFSVSLNPEEGAEWNQLYSEGQRFLSKGDFEGARPLFDRLVAIDNQVADVRYERGKILLQMEDFDGAKSDFKAARDLDIAPLRAITRIQMTVREVASEQNIAMFDFARYVEELQLERAGHTIPGNESFYDHCHPTIEMHQNIAGNLFTEAKGGFSRLKGIDWLEISPNHLYDSVMATLDPVYHGLKDLNLAKVLRWAGKREEALPFVRRAASVLPGHPEAQYLLGISFQEMAMYDSAIIAFSVASDLDPSNPRAYNSLGSVYLTLNRADRAIKMFDKAIETDSLFVSAHYNRANALYRSGRSEEAILSYERTLQINPDHMLASNNLGVAYMVKGDYATAIPLFKKTLFLNPANVEAYSNLGVISYFQGSMDESRDLFLRVLQLQPGDPFATEWLNRIAQQESGRGSE